MNNNELDIKTRSTEWTDFQTDHVLLLGQVTKSIEKALLSYFFKFLLASLINRRFIFAQTNVACASQNQKSCFFSNAPKYSELNTQLTLKDEAL
jgi:hypothetical protein